MQEPWKIRRMFNDDHRCRNEDEVHVYLLVPGNVELHVCFCCFVFTTAKEIFHTAEFSFCCHCTAKYIYNYTMPSLTHMPVFVVVFVQLKIFISILLGRWAGCIFRHIHP